MTNAWGKFARRAPAGLMAATAAVLLVAPSRAEAAGQAVSKLPTTEPVAGSVAPGDGLRQPGGRQEYAPSLELPQDDRGAELVWPGGDIVDGPVAQRARPDYDPVGIPLGGFRLFPVLSARAGYDGNVFARSHGGTDAYGRFRGAMTLRSEWGRHALAADAYVDERAYARYGSESGITYNAHVEGRYDLGLSDSITLEARRQRVFMERGAVSEDLQTLQPVRYDLTSGGGHTRVRAGRLTFDLAGLVENYDYQNAQNMAGATIDQQFRDYDRYEARLDTAYSSGTGTDLFLSLSREWRRYRLNASPRRDENGYEILGGVRGEITPLIRGQIGLGYISANFKAPQVSSRRGLAVDATIAYLVTRETTINLRARRYFENVSSLSSPASLTTELRLGVDHELLRNLILSISGQYQHADYIAAPLSARRFGAKFGALWLINRTIRIDLDAGYRKRMGRGFSPIHDYDEALASVGVSFQL